MEAGAAAGRRGGGRAASTCSRDEEAWDVLEEIPNDSAAALLLIEHHWAVPLRDAIARAGGFRISDGFISPLDLVEIGLVSARGGRGAPRAGDGAPGREPAAPPTAKEVEMFGSRRVARRTSRGSPAAASWLEQGV